MFSRGQAGGFPGWHGTSPYPVRLGWLWLSAMGQEVLGARTWGVSGRWTSGACRPAVLTLPGVCPQLSSYPGFASPLCPQFSSYPGFASPPFPQSLRFAGVHRSPFPQSLKVPGVHHSPFPQFRQLPWGSTTSPPNFNGASRLVGLLRRGEEVHRPEAIASRGRCLRFRSPCECNLLPMGHWPPALNRVGSKG